MNKEKTILPQPPLFTLDKLREILHYTDSPDNPSYEAYESNSYYEIQSGAKGVSKSYSGAIISIFRLVNEKIFNSLWCRNQYSHIKTTLRPMFESVLNFLKEEHNLDYTPYIAIYDSGIYWMYEDGGIGRAIFFENFEKIQAFQGKTLKNKNFRFGELVLDEPIEDPKDSGKQSHELQELYKLQEEKLPLLIANTVERLDAPKEFKVRIKFFYNIFDSNHFLVQKYHRQAINFIDDFNNLNNDVVEEMEEFKYVKRENKEFKGLGIIVIMYSKYFIPASKISNYQLQSYENLRNENYRLWVVTVLGMSFKDETLQNNYFMFPILFKSNGEFSDNVNIIEKETFKQIVKNGEIIGIYDGFDPGMSDKAAWVRIALTEEGKIIVIEAIDDLKKLYKSDKVSRAQTNNILIQIIKEQNQELKEWLSTATIKENSLQPDFDSYLFSDNDIVIEWLNQEFRNNSLNAQAYQAIRRDTKKESFGIESRQKWQQNIFQNGLIKLLNSSALLILPNLAKQLIAPYEKKRNEKVHPEIYDIINAFEMSASLAYKQQYIKLGEQYE